MSNYFLTTSNVAAMILVLAQNGSLPNAHTWNVFTQWTCDGDQCVVELFDSNQKMIWTRAFQPDEWAVIHSLRSSNLQEWLLKYVEVCKPKVDPIEVAWKEQEEAYAAYYTAQRAAIETHNVWQKERLHG
jgi:hypothetical protein